MENPFSAKDVCSIIRSCGSSSVAEFDYLGLKIVMGEKSQLATTEKTNSVEHQDSQNQLEFPGTAIEATPTEPDTDFDVDPLMDVSDPVLAEEMATREPDNEENT